MYDRALLLKDCQRLVKDLERDIRARVGADATLTATTSARYQEAVAAKQTSMTAGAWLTEQVTQAAVAWVLATVFVRFSEDNGLIDQAWIAGPVDADPVKNRLRMSELAREAYIVEHPSDTDVQYLQAAFRAFGAFPATRDLVAVDRNPLWTLPVSAQGARAIIAFWRETDRAGALVRDLRIEDIADTRWLGDLYQDLSADARKRFALLQTPDFVEEFILDYTLTPAIATFGLAGLRGIDPTCGSGHFLLGMFKRLLKAWGEQLGPAGEVKEAVSKAMQSIYGIDLNPFAVAISRFRLMLAGLAACNLRRLRDCPAFGFTLAVGNTLTLGEGAGFQESWQAEHDQDTPGFLIPGEYQNAKRVLSQQYHVVVGNPPYIAVKDAAERERIKPRYKSCFKKWTLSVPFTERFWTLTQNAKDPKTGASRPAGFVGLINSNNFTKREFGKALIEQVLPSLDLTHVIDTSGCYIPGHGTPTVILFGRNQRPSAQRPVRAVQGIRGEPGRPDDAAHGKVWTAMVENIGMLGAETPWLSVADVERKVFGQHPWSLGGGGVSELLAVLDASDKCCEHYIESDGYGGFPAANDVLIDPAIVHARARCERKFSRPLFEGDGVREWTARPEWSVFLPYSDDENFRLCDPHSYPMWSRWLWPFREYLWSRPVFAGGTYKDNKEPWWRWHQTSWDKFKTDRFIVYGQIATHNHFAYVRGRLAFKETAPIIKLNEGASDEDHYFLLSCLNSSVICFYLKQRCTGKHMADGGEAHATPEYQRFAFNAANIDKSPIPSTLRPERIALTRRLDALGQELTSLQPSQLFASQTPTRQLLDQTAARITIIRAEMIFLQEELDWLNYRAYGILTESECPLHAADTVPLPLGERAFEIDLARKVAAEEEETSWFERHRSTPITEIPAHWPADYRQVVQRRLDLITSHPHIGLLEKPEHKRRWQSDPWDEVVSRGLRDWLCDQLEDRRLWPDEPRLTSAQEIADRFFTRPEVQAAAELYRGNDVFDRVNLVAELLTAESVPYVPALRYSEEGMIKRADWEAVWELQRREDRGEAVGNIPVPPRYARADFQSEVYWSHRGKLDVPKERFISFPGAEREPDQTLVVLWAGYDHAQQARALIEHYQWAKSTAGWDAPRLTPLLVGLDQLIPWIKQWHNDLDPVHGSRLGDVYAEFLAGELQDIGLTVAAARAWRPVRQAGRRGRRRAAEQGAQP